MKNRQNRCARVWMAALFALGLLHPARARNMDADTGANAESAARLFEEGSYADAQKQVDAGIKSTPDSVEWNTLQLVMRVATGNLASARDLDAQLQKMGPGDPLALFASGLVHLADGDLATADTLFKNCENVGGDAAAVQGARSYIALLLGKPIPTHPESALGQAIEGVSAQRRGASAIALKAFGEAADLAPGDPFLQSAGLLASLDPRHPIAVSWPAQVRKAAQDEPKAVSGDLLISPTDVPANAAYASYELDGGPLSIVGSRPFSYSLDTRRVSNGAHTISISLLDGSGNEITKSERAIQVFNPRREPVARDAAGRHALWSALRLRPDRAFCSYQAGVEAIKVRDRNHAKVWLLRAAAIAPDYRDVREKLQECGGIPPAAPAVYSGGPTDKLVALTFDDGPKPGLTEPLLDLLKEYHAPSTFFVIGRHMQEYPDLAKAIDAAGMEIANHTYTHRSLTSLSSRDAICEALQSQAAILTLTGKLPKYLRPPGGNWNNRVARDMKMWGLTPCMWTVDVFDSEIIGPRRVAESVLKQTRPGSIVLMHNGKVSTLQALPIVLSELKRRGYRFVTVSELMRLSRGGKAGSQDGTRAHHTE